MLLENIFKKYKNDYFVETGSYEGDGIKLALDADFKHIISIELSDKFFNLCSSRFSNNTNVKLYKGDSELILFDVIKYINTEITFWLDGHYSACGTAQGNQETPLLFELEAIRKHKIKTHTIIVDDLRCWTKDRIGFDVEDLKNIILTINSDYNFKYENGVIENDVLVAYVK